MTGSESSSKQGEENIGVISAHHPNGEYTVHYKDGRVENLNSAQHQFRIVGTSDLSAVAPRRGAMPRFLRDCDKQRKEKILRARDYAGYRLLVE